MRIDTLLSKYIINVDDMTGKQTKKNKKRNKHKNS